MKDADNCIFMYWFTHVDALTFYQELQADMLLRMTQTHATTHTRPYQHVSLTATLKTVTRWKNTVPLLLHMKLCV